MSLLAWQKRVKEEKDLYWKLWQSLKKEGVGVCVSVLKAKSWQDIFKNHDIEELMQARQDKKWRTVLYHVLILDWASKKIEWMHRLCASPLFEAHGIDLDDFVQDLATLPLPSLVDKIQIWIKNAKQKIFSRPMGHKTFNYLIFLWWPRYKKIGFWDKAFWVIWGGLSGIDAVVGLYLLIVHHWTHSLTTKALGQMTELWGVVTLVILLGWGLYGARRLHLSQEGRKKFNEMMMKDVKDPLMKSHLPSEDVKPCEVKALTRMDKMNAVDDLMKRLPDSPLEHIRWR